MNDEHDELVKIDFCYNDKEELMMVKIIRNGKELIIPTPNAFATRIYLYGMVSGVGLSICLVALIKFFENYS